MTPYVHNTGKNGCWLVWGGVGVGRVCPHVDRACERVLKLSQLCTVSELSFWCAC